MAEKTSLSLSMTAANGDKMTKAVTDVNPAADNAALNEFAQGLAALTTNTLNTVSKITKQELSGTYTPITASFGTGSRNVTPTISDNSISFSSSDCWNDSDQYTGDGDTIRFVYVTLLFKAGTVDISPANFSVVAQPLSAIYPSICKAGDSNNDAQLSFWAAGVESVSELQGQGFSIFIPAGSSGSTAWDSTTFTVSIV